MNGGDSHPGEAGLPGRAADLRGRAEAVAGEKGSEGSSSVPVEATPGEMQRILHELRVHQIELEMQNEELRHAQAELETERSRYFDLYDLAPMGYVTVGENGLLLEANLTAATLLGLGRGTLPGKLFSRFILEEYQDSWYSHRRKLLVTGEPEAFELRMVRPDGKRIWARLDATAAREASGALCIRVAMSDVTDHKALEIARDKASRENLALLHELQHRAKNSFGTIIGLIGIASESDASPGTTTALAMLESRVRSVAALYALLYSSGSFAEVRLDDYCSRVAARLVEMSHNVSLETVMEDMTVTPNEAAPIGLILTELLTNVLKYAFPGSRTGKATVRLRKTPDGAVLEVEDDGGGPPAGFDRPGNAGMGLKLVRGLAAQIEGVFRIEAGPGGTRCALEFPLACSVDGDFDGDGDAGDGDAGDGDGPQVP